MDATWPLAGHVQPPTKMFPQKTKKQIWEVFSKSMVLLRASLNFGLENYDFHDLYITEACEFYRRKLAEYTIKDQEFILDEKLLRDFE